MKKLPVILLFLITMLVVISLSWGTVDTEDYRDGPYDTDGIVTVFAYTFPIQAQTQLRVFQKDDTSGAEVLLTLTTDYTVSGVDVATGGNVTISPAMADGYKIYIVRNVPLLQETDYENQAGFYPEIHEDSYDYLTMMVQEIQEEIDRCIQISVTSGRDVDDLLDALETVADSGGSVYSSEVLLSTYSGYLSAAVTAIGASERTLVIDMSAILLADQTIGENVPLRFTRNGLITTDSFTVTLNCSIVAGLWQIFDDSGTGSITGNPLVDGVYPEWFGAVGDGSNDDGAEVQSAVTLAAGGKCILSPDQNYLVNECIDVSSNTILYGYESTVTKGATFPDFDTVDYAVIIKVFGVDDVQVLGLEVDMNATALESTGVASGAAIAVYHFDSAHGPDSVDRKSGFLIRDCSVINTNIGISIMCDVEDVVIDSCTVKDAYGVGITADIQYPGGVTAHYPRRIKIVNCSTISENTSSGSAGIYLSGSTDVLVQGNYVNDNHRGILCYVNDGGRFIKRVNIIGNHVLINATTVTDIDTGIQIFGMSVGFGGIYKTEDWFAEDITIANNVVECETDFTTQKTNLKTGISCTMGKDFLITGNTIKNWPRGISIGGFNSSTYKEIAYGVVSNNRVIKSSLSPVYCGFIARVLFEGNYFYNWNIAATTSLEYAGINIAKHDNIHFKNNVFYTDDGNDAALRTHCFYVRQAFNCSIRGSIKSPGIQELNIQAQDITVDQASNFYYGNLETRNIWGITASAGHYDVGDRIILKAPHTDAGSDWMERICTVTGTRKTAATITATTTNGGTTVEVNGTTDLHVGDEFTIDTVGVSMEITDIDYYDTQGLGEPPYQITVTPAADADATDETIRFTTPTMVFGSETQ